MTGQGWLLSGAAERGSRGVSDTLRDIAEWLDANPDLEVTSVSVSIAAHDRAAIKRVARALGGNPKRVAWEGNVWLESDLLTYPDPLVRVTSGHVPAVDL